VRLVGLVGAIAKCADRENGLVGGRGRDRRQGCVSFGLVIFKRSLSAPIVKTALSAVKAGIAVKGASRLDLEFLSDR